MVNTSTYIRNGNEAMEDYLSRVHDELIDTKYGRTHGNPESCASDYSCLQLANSIAMELASEGKDSTIRGFPRKGFDGVWKLTSDVILEPLVFEGDIQWNRHAVACADDMVYDPVLGSEPIPIEEYSQLMFGEKISSEIIENDYMEKYGEPEKGFKKIATKIRKTLELLPQELRMEATILKENIEALYENRGYRKYLKSCRLGE